MSLKYQLFICINIRHNYGKLYLVPLKIFIHNSLNCSSSCSYVIIFLLTFSLIGPCDVALAGMMTSTLNIGTDHPQHGETNLECKHRLPEQQMFGVINT
jgi:hypothetical protein